MHETWSKPRLARDRGWVGIEAGSRSRLVEIEAESMKALVGFTAVNILSVQNVQTLAEGLTGNNHQVWGVMCIHGGTNCSRCILERHLGNNQLIKLELLHNNASASIVDQPINMHTVHVLVLSDIPVIFLKIEYMLNCGHLFLFVMCLWDLPGCNVT